jgi:hypothetical protein
MKSWIFLSVALASLLSAGCNNGPKARTALQITTRAGGNFLVVLDHVEYLKNCYAGSYDPYEGTDDQGLRASAPDPDPKQKQWEEIRWRKIDSVSFGATSGDAGGFCPGTPTEVAAVVAHGDDRDNRSLLTTTDEGIIGSTERGRVTIAIQDIAKLVKIPDQHWPWSEANPDPYDVTLKIVQYDGKPAEIKDPSIAWNRTKKSSFEELTSPFSNSNDNFLVFGDGARQEIPWHFLKSFDLLALDASGKQRVHVAFTDGSSRDFDLLGEEIHGSGGDADFLPMDYVRHADVLSERKPATPPPAKPAS